MKIVVIGARGMLGRAVMDACQVVGWEVAGYDLPELDITKMDGREVEEADWLVNCAAYTNVNKAEEEASKAFEVNAVGAGNLVRMCNQQGWKMLQVSTDYVFDGKILSGMSYDEDDQTNPVNVYGMSKLMGEYLVQQERPGALVVRTQSLFGNYGVNFVEAILKQLADGKKTLEVVADQFSCPTYVVHLAQGMVALMENNAAGVVNCSAEGSCSWYEFAREILVQSGIDSVIVQAIKTGHYPVKAVRPSNSALCKARYEVLTGDEMPHWKDMLREYLSQRKGWMS